MTPPVTEIALLRLKSPAPSASFKALLLEGIKAQAEFSSYPVYLFTQVEDPSLIYLVGGWDSAQQHYEDWIPSTTNQGIMAQLSSEMELVWMFHVDGDAVRQGELLAEAPVVAVGRYFMSAEKREGFSRVFEGVQHRLEEFTRPLPIFKGWRVEKEEGKEEFVLFSGWAEVQQHLDFAQSEGFQEFSKIKEYTDSSEVKHIVRWKVE
jgi:heme-degrading monooxygenase HmoA